MPSSRFKVFNLKPDAAPTPPPKDLFYNRSFFSRSAASLVPSLTPESVSGPSTPASEFPKRSNLTSDFPSPFMDARTDSSGSCPTNDLYLVNGANASSYTVASKPKKGVFKLASLARRNRSKKDLSDAASASSRSATLGEQPATDADDGISMPWNFQHNIHVDEGYIGLPPSWTSTLSQVGFHQDEIAAIHARRRAAATATVSPANSPSTSTSSPTILLDPVPRSTSLRRGRDALILHPPSSYSTTTAGASTIGPSPVSSPRAPSFSIKSFVSGVKNSLSTDSANSNDGHGTPPEESDQFVFVDGDGPDGPGTGNDSFIDPYLFGFSSHQTYSPRIHQEQQTPQTPTFPQIQVQRAHSDLGHVSIPRAPSPLAQSNSLPVPSSSSPSIANARRGPASAPPRTPPRRVYHVVNGSSDSIDGPSYAEPPPAYASPGKAEWLPNREKEGLGGPPPPNRPIPPIPAEEAAVSGLSSREEASDATGSSADDILDISSYYTDRTDADADRAQAISSTQPLAIDKRIAKLTTLPPRISLHQDSLDDWSLSLFSAIGKEKRSSVLVAPRSGDAASVNEKRSTLRSTSPLVAIREGTSVTALSPETVAPTLPDMSFGAPGPHARQAIDAVEGDEQEQEEVMEEQPVETTNTTEEEEDVAPSTPVLPDVSPGPNVSSIGKDLEPPAPSPPPPPESPPRTSVDSLPPSPPPKPKPKPAPLAIIIPPAATLAPPRTNVIPGISGKSPVNPLFGAKPQPLPIPIPPSQIRAQLRPAPPKPAHPSPLPPLKRLPSQINLQLPLTLSSQLPLPPTPSPLKSPKHTSTVPPSDPRPNSSQTLVPAHGNVDRDSGMSTITVTPATISTAKSEVVRTAVASVVDSDAVSLASRRESLVSTADAQPDALACDEPDTGRESPRLPEREDVPGDSLVSETSVSLLRDGSQSKWPTPPPPPVELEVDSTPPRMSRFRTTSLGRVSQLQAMTASPIVSHFSRGSSDTTSSTTSESAGVSGTSPQAPKANGCLAAETRFLSSTADTFGGVDDEASEKEEEDGGESEEDEAPAHLEPEPSTPTASESPAHPLLAQLRPYLSPRDPAVCFTDLVEIAEGESGSVFAARVAPSPEAGNGDGSVERPVPSGASHVAIKRIPLPPAASSLSLSDDTPISNKLVSVVHELRVLKGLEHEHLLLLDGVYVGSSASSDSAAGVDTSLWIRMELMERSLADVIGLVGEGLALQERMIARFASDILHGLDYLQRQHVAHRDVRSDNLLVNASGVVKLADFSNAIRVDRNAPMASGAVGVIYWQAPEMRAGPYNALKVDAWSLGATVWELAETVPPFSSSASPSTQVSFAIHTARRIGSQWPPLTHPQHYSRQFHEFLKLCGRESAGRPCPGELLNTAFVRNACGRAVILQLLAQCHAIEETMANKTSS